MSILRKIIERVAPMGPADVSRLDLLDRRTDVVERLEHARVDRVRGDRARGDRARDGHARIDHVGWKRAA